MWTKAAVACLAVLIASSALVWYRYHYGAVPGDIEVDVRRTVRLHPGLEPMYEEAVSDGVLSMKDVERIVEAAEANADEMTE